MRSVACIIVFAALGCRSAAEPPETLRSIDGPGVRELALRSEAPIVVVNFWATWCAPCKAELPELVEVAERYPGRVALHFVSLDSPSERDAAEAFLRTHEAPLPSWLKRGKDDPFITAVHDRWTGSIPMTMVYGPDDTVRYFWEGRITGAQLASAIETLLGESS